MRMTDRRRTMLILLLLSLVVHIQWVTLLAQANPLSKAELDQLEHVWNCRDVAWEVPVVRPGKLLRCGNSDSATEKDVELITRHFGKISSMVDLRTLGEVDPTAFRRLREYAEHHSIPLGDRDAIGRVLTQRASWFSMLKYAYHRFIEWDMKKAQSEMIQYINGLAGFNRLILQNEGASLSKALRVITTSVERGNVLISCTAGKDRTGLVVSLALAIAGVPRNQIAWEYHQSHRHKETILRRAIQHATDAEEWAGAPEQIVFDTFNFIDEHFGSVDLFLASIGFDRPSQRRLKSALTGMPDANAYNSAWSRIL